MLNTICQELRVCSAILGNRHKLRFPWRTHYCHRAYGVDPLCGLCAFCSYCFSLLKISSCGGVEYNHKMAQPKIPVKYTRRLLFFAPSRLCIFLVIVFQFNARAQRRRDAKGVVNLSLHVFCVVVHPTDHYENHYISRQCPTRLPRFPQDFCVNLV